MPRKAILLSLIKPKNICKNTLSIHRLFNKREIQKKMQKKNTKVALKLTLVFLFYIALC